MATGYVLKHSQTAISPSGTNYTTTTNLLTVAAGHLYLIKSVRAILETNWSGAATQIPLGLELSDNAGANFKRITNPVSVSSAGSVSGGELLTEFSGEPQALDAAQFGTNFAANIVHATTESRRASVMGTKDLHMEAGQILRFTPMKGASGMLVATSNSSVLRFEISYIDYTI